MCRLGKWNVVIILLQTGVTNSSCLVLLSVNTQLPWLSRLASYCLCYVQLGGLLSAIQNIWETETLSSTLLLIFIFGLGFLSYCRTALMVWLNTSVLVEHVVLLFSRTAMELSSLLLIDTIRTLAIPTGDRCSAVIMFTKLFLLWNLTHWFGSRPYHECPMVSFQYPAVPCVALLNRRITR